MWTIFKLFIEFVTIQLLNLYDLVFGHEVHEILAPKLGIDPTPTVLEGEVLTTGPAGKSQDKMFIYIYI